MVIDLVDHSDSGRLTRGLAGVAAQRFPQLLDDADSAEAQAPEEQLRTVVARLSQGVEWSAQTGAEYEPLGRVLVFRPWPARSLHVVGDSPLAEEFRRLVACGAVPGWGLHPMPQRATPLAALAGPLLRRTASRRFYSLLERQGFAFVEEVAATPDGCLLELRNCGPRLIAAVRAVISELGPEDDGARTARTSSTADTGGPGHVPNGLPPDATDALQVIAAWGVAECGAQTLGEMLTLAPAAAGMPPEVARCWDRLAQLSLRPLAGTPESRNLTRLAAELLGEADERRRRILTSRTFAPDKRTYSSLAGELGISPARVRELEQSALIQLTMAARQDRYAPLRWRVGSAVRHGVAVPAPTDAPLWMAKLTAWLASKTD